MRFDPVTLVAIAIVAFLGYRAKEQVMSANQARIDALADQVDKAKNEVVAAVDALKAQVEAGETLDFSRLDSAVQTLDDLNPDAVVEPEPTPEPDPELPLEDGEIRPAE